MTSKRLSKAQQVDCHLGGHHVLRPRARRPHAVWHRQARTDLRDADGSGVLVERHQ